MESFRHASYRAASLLKTRALPVCRLTSRVTIKDLRVSPAILAAKTIQSRFFGDYQDRGQAVGLRSRDSNSANLNEPEQEPRNDLYVGNLFFDVTSGQLRQHFESYGEITNVRVITNAEGHSKGFGFVSFSTVEAATKAKEALNLSVFAGRRILVHYGRNNPTNSRSAPADRTVRTPSSTLFVGNLHYDMTDSELNALFRPLRDIRDVRVSIDKRTGHPRGFAHADFFSEAAATAAMAELQGREVSGRILRIDYGVASKRQYGPNGERSVVNPSAEPTQDATSSTESTQDATSTTESTQDVTSSTESTQDVTSSAEPTQDATSSAEPTQDATSSTESTQDVTSSTEQSHEEHSEGTSQPAENISDHPETDKEKEFEQPGQGPEEQLHEEVDKTPEDQAKQ